METLSFFQQWGLPGVALGIIAGFAGYLLRQVFKSHNEDRKIWREMIIKDFANLQEGHQHQRREHQELGQHHKEITDVLRRINGKH